MVLSDDNLGEGKGKILRSELLEMVLDNADLNNKDKLIEIVRINME